MNQLELIFESHDASGSPENTDLNIFYMSTKQFALIDGAGRHRLLQFNPTY
jgi:hypothetical protein